MQRNLSKIALSCLLVIGGCGVAHAWTMGTGGSSNFSGNITGGKAIGWEALSKVQKLPDVDINDFKKHATNGKYEAKFKVTDVMPLFSLHMKESGKLNQLYDNIDIRYLDSTGRALTPTAVAAGNSTLELDLPATTASGVGATVEVKLPLQVDSLVRLVVPGSNKYAELHYGVDQTADSIMSGFGCDSTKKCIFGTYGSGRTDEVMRSLVKSKLNISGNTLATLDSKHFEVKGIQLGANAKPNDKLGLAGTDANLFTVDKTTLMIASSLFIDPLRDVVISATSKDAVGDWNAVLNMEVTTN